MITIIPSQEILKAVTDMNIISDGSSARRQAFTDATDLISMGCTQILIEGQLYAKIKTRLNNEHQKFFEDTYRIDNSTVDVPEFSGNIVKSIKWIASSEAHIRQVLILTENKQDYAGIATSELKSFTPREFIEKYKEAQRLIDTQKFATLEDALTAVFFLI